MGTNCEMIIFSNICELYIYIYIRNGRVIIAIDEQWVY